MCFSVLFCFFVIFSQFYILNLFHIKFLPARKSLHLPSGIFRDYTRSPSTQASLDFLLIAKLKKDTLNLFCRMPGN